MKITEFFNASSDENQLSIRYNSSLNPALWEGENLREKVAAKLNEIANEFIEFLEVPSLDVIDVIITGSNANYNWTNLSDIDLHVVTELDKIQKACPEIADDFFNSKKHIWNNNHDITIYGHPVELYVQDADEPHVATGIYSLMDEKWVKKPTYSPPSFNDSAVQKKADQLKYEIDELIENKANIQAVEDLKERIKKYRKAGLQKGGEWSTGNLVFKELRNSGYIDKLYNYASSYKDQELSLESLSTLKEEIIWNPDDLDQYKSLQSLIKTNNGVFKSKKQASFIYNKWANKIKDTEFKENVYGITIDSDNKYIELGGIYTWASYGSKSQIPFYYVFELDKYGIVNKWKIGAKGNLKIGAKPDPDKAKLEFTRPGDVDISHLEDTEAEKKAKFAKKLGMTEGEHLGKVGERYDFGEVTLVFSKSTGYYSPNNYTSVERFFNVFKDKDGNVIWYNSYGDPAKINQGESANMVAQVKDHTVSNRQERVTVVKRPRFKNKGD